MPAQCTWRRSAPQSLKDPGLEGAGGSGGGGGGGGGGATKALVVAMATMHTARLKRGEKQEMSDTPEVPARSVSAACPSTKPLQLPAAMNCANVLMGCHLVNGVLHIRTRSNVSQKQRAAAATDLRGGMSAIALSVLRAPGH